MITWQIKGGTLEFDEDDHIYLYEGVIIPSVTEMVRRVYPNKYKGIPRAVLDNAAEKGREVHSAIEMYETAGELSSLPELRNYLWLKKQYGFECVENELPVVVFLDGKAVMAGRLDMITKQDDLFGVEDIKRTSAVDKNGLFYQLNWYAIGVQQCYGTEISYLKCLHLREERRKRIDIPLNEIEATNKLKELLKC